MRIGCIILFNEQYNAPNENLSNKKWDGLRVHYTVHLCLIIIIVIIHLGVSFILGVHLCLIIIAILQDTSFNLKKFAEYYQKSCKN